MPTDGAPFSVAVGKHFNFRGGDELFLTAWWKRMSNGCHGKTAGNVMHCTQATVAWAGLRKAQKKQRVPTLITRNSKCVRRSTCFAEGCTCCLTSVPLANADVAEQRNVVTPSLATSLSSFIFFKHFNLYIYRMPWTVFVFSPGAYGAKLVGVWWFKCWWDNKIYCSS